ncbi:MAG: metallophosphoesterase [Chlamydiae bacterium]|nr:metallophosphoesterase [Chlamydiota bacterium]
MTSKPERPFRIAHLSDLHFSSNSFHLSHFLSKRWLGTINLLFSRKKDFNQAQLFPLIEQLKENKITHAIISGDFSTTSLEKELSEAASYVEELKKAGIQTFTLPGNHDHYTKKSYKKKIFYQFFPSHYSDAFPYTLKDHGLTIVSLKPGWWIILLDTILATSFVSSQGYFSPELEKQLTEALSALPREDSIIMANHYPLFHMDGSRKNLIRGETLRKIISKYSNIKFYLHGHTHRLSIADLRPNELPIILDPGCSSHRKNGGYHIIDLLKKGCHISTYLWQDEWRLYQQKNFNWESSDEPLV